MTLSENERRYLVRLTTTTFSDTDRNIRAARKTLVKLYGKGLVRLVTLDGDERDPALPADADAFWEITEAGLAALSPTH